MRPFGSRSTRSSCGPCDSLLPGRCNNYGYTCGDAQNNYDFDGRSCLFYLDLCRRVVQNATVAIAMGCSLFPAVSATERIAGARLLTIFCSVYKYAEWAGGRAAAWRGYRRTGWVLALITPVCWMNWD